MFQNKAVAIRHELPGRIRFKIRKPRQERARRADALARTPGVILIRVNEKCAGLIVRFNPKVISRDKLVALVWAVFAPDRGAETERAPARSRPSPNADDNAVPRAMRRFLGVSAVVGVAFVRTSILGLTVSQAALSPLGLLAFGFGAPLIRSGIKKLRQKRIDLDGFLGAGIVAATVAGEALTAFEILWINSGAELLTAWTRERSRRSISEILDITSHHTFVLEDGVEVERNVEDVLPGQTVVLHTGEKVSVDGEIVKGEAVLNEAPITGRQEFAHKREGELVYAGTFVREGVIFVKCVNVGDATYLARVMSKVQDELTHRAPIEGAADSLASTLVRIGLASTAATFLITGSAWRAFTVLLVMACPCATVLAASTAVSSAISAAARSRILIKGGRYLEEVGKCDTVCFDKTGTLTSHEPELREIATVQGVDEDDLLRMAVSAESHNHHPLAQAVKAEAGRRKIEPVAHTVCDYRMGLGVRAEIEGDEVLVGNGKFLEENGVVVAALVSQADRMRNQGLSVLYVAKNREAQGALGLNARVKLEAANVIRRLRAMGVKSVVLITGDEECSAWRLAHELGCERYYASVMPEDKANIVSEIMDGGRRKVLMVGDGVNDTLALTRADVGAAIGVGGAEAAIESADIALANDSLEALADVYGLSQDTLRIVRQNFWIATGSNLVGVVFGALGMLSPVMAGMVHIGHTLGVVANSSRLLTFSSNNINRRPSVEGRADGFQINGGVAALPGGQAPHSGQDADQVPGLDHQGPEGDSTGQKPDQPGPRGAERAA